MMNSFHPSIGTHTLHTALFKFPMILSRIFFLKSGASQKVIISRVYDTLKINRKKGTLSDEIQMGKVDFSSVLYKLQLKTIDPQRSISMEWKRSQVKEQGGRKHYWDRKSDIVFVYFTGLTNTHPQNENSTFVVIEETMYVSVTDLLIPNGKLVKCCCG